MASGARRLVDTAMDDSAIILNYTKIRDNLIVVHALTRAYGRKSFLVKTGAKAKMAYYLPLNILELSITENTKSDLWYASPLAAKYPLLGIRNNVFKNTMSLFMAEVVYRTIKDGAQEDGLFDWCVRQILTLDALQADFSNYHIYFLLEFCIALGFRPEATDMIPFTGEYQPFVEQFMHSDLPTAMLIPLSGRVRSEIASSIIRYLEFHTESTINIRSLQVLHELFV